MRVGIIQSNYIPWRGYFDFIDDVNLFIFYDDVLYGQGKKWRNRNRIKTSKGLVWLTVPLKHGRADKLINEVEIDYSQDWPISHVRLLKANYGESPYFTQYIDEFFGIISKGFQTISELNVNLCRWIMAIMGITSEIRMSHEFKAVGDKRQRPLNILRKVAAKEYVLGPSAEPYTDLDLFREHGIRLEYKSYDYQAYPQLWGEFIGEVTILDLLFNTGPEARQYLKSRTPNQVVVT